MSKGSILLMDWNATSSGAGERKTFLRDALPRGLALFLGGFSLVNLAGDFRAAHFDETIWWVDLRFLPANFARFLLLVSASCLVGYAVRPPRSAWRRYLTIGCMGLLGALSVTNSVRFYYLLARGTITSAMIIPLSLLVSIALGLVLAANVREPAPKRTSGNLLQVLAVTVLCAVAFPLAQMFCFGKTDYRRPADVAVVLGARVYADGRPSDALADRVRTACALYRDGLTGKLLLSGGPGDGAVTEAEAMKRMAVRLGVKPADILVDEAGVNTQATVRNSEAFFTRLGCSRILVVSHFYHLPRIKLAYERAGREVYTVPAKESYWLRQLPYNMFREVAAFWVYYLRPLGTRG